MGAGAGMGQPTVALKRIAKVHSGTAHTVLVSDDLQQGSVEVFGANGVFAQAQYSNTCGPVIIVSRKTPIGKIYWSDKPCWASETTFFIEQNNAHVDLRWLYYALQTLVFDLEPSSISLNRVQFEQMRLHLPKQQTQRQMAHYLDVVMAKLLQLIADKQALLALCAERKRSLINRATLLGLQENDQLKDSGVQSIGVIPVAWQCVALKRLIHSCTQGTILATLPMAASKGEFGVVKAAAVKDGLFDPAQNHVLQAMHDFTPELAIHKDDMLITRAGNFALAEAHYPQFTFAENLFRLRLNNKKILAKWLYWILLSDAGKMQIDASALSGERVNLSQREISSWPIPLPPMAAQKEIAAYLSAEVNKLDQLTQATQHSIALLHERRHALLKDVISGQWTMKEEQHDFA